MKLVPSHVFAGLFAAGFSAWLVALAAGCSRGPDLQAAELWCQEHGVEEKFCILCHPEIKNDPSILLCKEHFDIPEAICTACHPELKAKYKTCPHELPVAFCPQCRQGNEVQSDWCAQHGVPESLCTVCRPELAKTLEMCREHGVPEALCTICRPELAQNFVLCKPHHLPAAFCPRCRQEGKPGAAVQKPDTTGASASGSPPDPSRLPLVRLAGPEVAADAGIKAVAPRQASLAPVVTANGEVGYDETRLARVRPRVPGVIREVYVKPGDTVREGQLLALVDSAELGQAKADYLAALPMAELSRQTLARVRGLSEAGSVEGKLALEAEAQARRAEADVIKARQRLRNLGLDQGELARLAEEDEELRNRLRVTAHAGGTVVEFRAVAGDAVHPDTELFSIADLAHVWLHLDVYEKDLRRIAVGQPVAFRVPGLAPADFRGKIIWIDSAVNDKTRTIRVRAELENSEGWLRANMYGQGEIQVGDQHVSLVVPRESVQWEGSSWVVFVQQTRDRYEPRRVLLGQNGGAEIELAWANLKPGERVVTAGSFLLKTEIQKGAIGAGCCGE